MNITVVGTGYVGTVTGACLAELGHQVIGTDVNEGRIARLAEGHLHFYEPELEPMLRTNLDEGRLRFTPDIKTAIRDAEVVFLCVGTQPLPDGSPDLKPLMRAVDDLADALSGYTLIVEKSTVPVKTGEWLMDLLNDRIANCQGEECPTFDIAAVPQFLREGYAVQDFMNPDRLIIGTASQKAIDVLNQIYAPLKPPVLLTDINSAELIKHATNALLATKISFINTIAQICEKTGADITEVAKGLGMDKRINPEYLNPGVGYGGIFFSKDIQSLLKIADEYHINLDLLKSTETTNRYQRLKFIDKVAAAVTGREGRLEERLEGKTVAIWGLAYRPDTNDMRDAPSLTIISGLLKRGAKIRAYDPIAMPATREVFPKITYCDDPYQAAEGADVIAVLTSWPEIAQLNFAQLKEKTSCRTIVDGRNLYNPERMRTQGLHYISIGRSSVDGRATAAAGQQQPELADDPPPVAAPLGG